MKRTAMCLLISLMMSIFIVAQEKPKSEAPKAPTEAPKAPTKDEAKKEGNSPSSPAAASPSVDEILEKYVKALGGKEAIEKLRSRISKGSFDIEAANLSGSLESFAKAPNKNATNISIQGFGDINSVYDGTKGWSSDPFSGLRELSGLELATTKRESDFYSPLNFKKNYTKLEVKGREKVASSEAYVVEATPAEGTPEKFYFDANTGLVVRQDSERESPQGKLPAEIYFEDYKEVDGIKIPYLTKFITPAFAFSVKLTEVKHNLEIDEAKFNKPSATQ
jgi:zinc protease